MALSSSKEALVVGWIIAVGLCSGCAARNPTPLDLRDKLWKDASEVFERRGVVLTDEGREPLQALIASGSATLEEKGASAQEIKAAEDAIRAFAEDVVVQANRNGPNKRGIVEVLAKDVQMIRKKVCPLFPFCK